MTDIADVIINDIKKLTNDDDVVVKELSTDTHIRCRFWYGSVRIHVILNTDIIIIHTPLNTCKRSYDSYTDIRDHLAELGFHGA